MTSFDNKPNFGKRIIPRDKLEFEDLIFPYYENRELDRCYNLLIRYWKRKGKSSRALYEISQESLACCFQGGVDISTVFVRDAFGGGESNLAHEHDDIYCVLFEDEFKAKFTSVHEFLHLCFDGIVWNKHNEIEFINKNPYFYHKVISTETKYLNWWVYTSHNGFKLVGKLFAEHLVSSIQIKCNHLLRKRLHLPEEEVKWKQEALLLDRLRIAFPNEIIQHQGSPSWLEGQRFDVWFPEKKIAVEFNGVQHYEPISFFGGEEGLKETQNRDNMKRKKCRLNNSCLIEVREGYNVNSLIHTISQFLGG